MLFVVERTEIVSTADGVGWDGVEWCRWGGMGWNRVGWGGMGWDGVEWGEMIPPIPTETLKMLHLTLEVLQMQLFDKRTFIFIVT